MVDDNHAQHFISLNPYTSPMMGIISVLLQMREHWLREVKWLAQDHSSWESEFRQDKGLASRGY